jgi:hypothetical protein
MGQNSKMERKHRAVPYPALLPSFVSQAFFEGREEYRTYNKKKKG